MTEVEFTSTDHGTQVFVFAEMIIGAMYLPVRKSTVLMGVGGGAIPITCTPEEAMNKLKAALAAKPTSTKGGNDGI